MIVYTCCILRFLCGSLSGYVHVSGFLCFHDSAKFQNLCTFQNPCLHIFSFLYISINHPTTTGEREGSSRELRVRIREHQLTVTLKTSDLPLNRPRTRPWGTPPCFTSSCNNGGYDGLIGETVELRRRLPCTAMPNSVIVRLEKTFSINQVDCM